MTIRAKYSLRNKRNNNNNTHNLKHNLRSFSLLKQNESEKTPQKATLKRELAKKKKIQKKVKKSVIKVQTPKKKKKSNKIISLIDSSEDDNVTDSKNENKTSKKRKFNSEPDEEKAVVLKKEKSKLKQKGKGTNSDSDIEIIEETYPNSSKRNKVLNLDEASPSFPSFVETTSYVEIPNSLPEENNDNDDNDIYFPNKKMLKKNKNKGKKDKEKNKSAQDVKPKVRQSQKLKNDINNTNQDDVQNKDNKSDNTKNTKNVVKKNNKNNKINDDKNMDKKEIFIPSSDSDNNSIIIINDNDDTNYTQISVSSGPLTVETISSSYDMDNPINLSSTISEEDIKVNVLDPITLLEIEDNTTKSNKSKGKKKNKNKNKNKKKNNKKSMSKNDKQSSDQQDENNKDLKEKGKKDKEEKSKLTEDIKDKDIKPSVKTDIKNIKENDINDNKNKDIKGNIVKENIFSDKIPSTDKIDKNKDDNTIVNSEIDEKDDQSIKQSLDDIITSYNITEGGISDKDIINDNIDDIIDDFISDQGELNISKEDINESDSLISDYESDHNQPVVSPSKKIDKEESDGINFNFKDRNDETPLNTFENKLLNLNDSNDSDSDDIIDSPLKNKVGRSTKSKTNVDSTEYSSKLHDIYNDDENIIKSSYEDEYNIQKEKVLKVKRKKETKMNNQNKNPKNKDENAIETSNTIKKKEKELYENQSNSKSSDSEDQKEQITDNTNNDQNDSNSKSGGTDQTSYTNESIDDDYDYMSLAEIVKKNQERVHQSSPENNDNTSNNDDNAEKIENNMNNNNNENIKSIFSIDEKTQNDKKTGLIQDFKKNNEIFESNLFYPKDSELNIFDNSNSSLSDNSKSTDSDNSSSIIFKNSVNNLLFNEDEHVIQKTFDWIFKYRCIAKNVEPSFENLTLVNSLIPLTSKPNQLHSPTPLLLFSYSQTLINSLKNSEPTQTHYENLLLWIETLEIKRRSDVFKSIHKSNPNNLENSIPKDKNESRKSPSKKTPNNTSPKKKNKIDDDGTVLDNEELPNNGKEIKDKNQELGRFSTDSSLENKIEKRFENAYLLLKKKIFVMELQKKPFNPVNCKALLNKLFPVNDEDTEAIVLKHYPSPRLDFASVIYSMEEYLQLQKISMKKGNRKKKSNKSKESENNDNKEETPIYEFEKSSSWKQTKVALEFYLNSIRKCLY